MTCYRNDGIMMSAIIARLSSITAVWQRAWARKRLARASRMPNSSAIPIAFQRRPVELGENALRRTIDRKREVPHERNCFLVERRGKYRKNM